MKTKIQQSVLGGIIATAVMTMVMFMALFMGMPKMNPAAEQLSSSFIFKQPEDDFKLPEYQYHQVFSQSLTYVYPGQEKRAVIRLITALYRVFQ